MRNSATAFPAAANRDGTAPRRAARLHARAVAHQHRVGGRHYLAATTGRRRRVERTLDDDLSRPHPARQGDAAAVVLHRVRFDDAGVVHNAREQRVLGAGAHEDLPTVRPNHAAVVRQTVQHARIYLHMQEMVAGESECRRAARAERHAA